MLFVAGGGPHAGTTDVAFPARSRFVDAGCGAGDDVLQLALDTLPEVIVIDVASPDVDGFAVAAALQADPRTRPIPIVAIASHWTPAVQQEARRVGISTVLLTPCSPAYFAAEVERVVRQSQLLSAALGHITVGADPALPVGLRNAVRRRHAY